MAGTHDGRVLEETSGVWSTTDAWPVPVECLLSGMTDTQLMFGGGGMIQHQFRHRFHPPPSDLGGAHVISINPNVSLPPHAQTHTIMEGSVGSDERNGSVVGQENISQNIPLREDVLDESEESSEEEEDLSGSGNGNNPMSLTHSLTHNTHNTLVQVGCGSRGSVVHAQIPMGRVSDTPPHHHHLHQAHPKLGNGVSVSGLGHDLGSVHGGVPINPIFLQQEVGFDGGSGEDGGNDPNTGFSVYGKLYYEREGRVVLHLKQSLDSPSDQNVGDGMSFAPSDPHNGKTLFQGCALCRLRSPNQGPYRNQKQGHRHTFRGVLFTFEECTIVELYPEQTHHGINLDHHNDLKENGVKLMRAHGGGGEGGENEPNLGLSSYLPRRVEEELGDEVMVMESLGQVDPPPGPPGDKETPHHQEWWDEFESDEEVKENDDSSEMSEDEGDGGSPLTGREEDHLHSSQLPTLPQPQQMGEEESTYAEESTNYAPLRDSSFLQHELSDEEVVERKGGHSARNPELDSLLLGGLMDEKGGDEIGRGEPSQTSQDENLATPRGEEDPNSEELNFSLAESEVDVEETRKELKTHPPPTQLLTPTPRVKVQRKFECAFCEKVLRFKKSFLIHLEGEHPENPLRCSKCGTQFGDGNSLATHPCRFRLAQKPKKGGGRGKRESRRRGEPVQVQVKVSSDEIQWRDPRDPPPQKQNTRTQKCGTRKGNKRRPFPPQKQTKPFSCTICGKSFSVQRRLDTHSLSHVNDKSCQCEKCGKRFGRKDKLIRHMYVHSDEKMFECSTCSKRFSRRDKLSDHVKSHGSRDESHHCPFCQKEFLRPDILKQHVKLHGMGNKHQCTECLRFVTGKERLEQHMARHEEAKAQGQPLLCPLCTKNFIQRQSLKAHIKKFHPMAHARLLSDLDFPATDQLDLDEERGDESQKVREEDKGKVGGRRFPCEDCSKHFSKKGALGRHSAKHHPPSTSTTGTELIKEGSMDPGGSPLVQFSAHPVNGSDVVMVMVNGEGTHGLSFTSEDNEIVSGGPRNHPTGPGFLDLDPVPQDGLEGLLPGMRVDDGGRNEVSIGVGVGVGDDEDRRGETLLVGRPYLLYHHQHEHYYQ